ncbi:hypothetical protein K491DRAFT_698695 [Lophiostoma macrostomum CBS 122681]|uniref:Uncharacterized protein n=1 Tax=Lophiostoma macrostomum CBS 122681 TaxID=1314788 RepID=A0A6A6SLW7_9PLEO|nr:hypothetical protein K491DRAFT_698695 [Lophiostoma macrostomum CBS 122681]
MQSTIVSPGCSRAAHMGVGVGLPIHTACIAALGQVVSRVNKRTFGRQTSPTSAL